MPQLIFPAKPFGLFVDVVVGVPGAIVSYLHSARKPIPTPQRALGLIDTGSDITVVHIDILKKLGVLPHQTQVPSQIVGTLRQSDVYEISLGIQDFTDPASPSFVQPDLLVIDMPSSLDTVEVVIGLDVLLECKLLLDGPGRVFTLDF